jgi:hypothetical protein
MWRLYTTKTSWEIDEVSLSSLTFEIVGVFSTAEQDWVWSGTIAAVASVFHDEFPATISFDETGITKFEIDYRYVIKRGGEKSKERYFVLLTK